MSWQGDQGYNCAARDPHAAQVAVVIGRLRGQLQTLVMSLLPLAAMIVLYGTDATNSTAEQGAEQGADHANTTSNSRSIAAAATSARVLAELKARYPDSPADAAQQRVPLLLREVLPPWAAGAFAAAMMGFFLSTHTTYLHAWGTVLVQDVLLPITGPRDRLTHLRWLRRSVVLVALLIFLWSWLVPTRDFILMFMSLSGSCLLLRE